MQAVSKWENNLSCPDIALLPQLAEYFEVSIDYLVTGKQVESTEYQENVVGIPDDDKIETSGDANCGNVYGGVTAEGDVSCGDVSGAVTVQGDLKCKEIQGALQCEGDIQWRKDR